MKALILLNFKTYEEAVGKKAIVLAKKIAQARKNGYKIIISPSVLDLREIIKTVNLPVFSQHADLNSLGAHTGSVPLDQLKSLGVTGTLLNHSEKKIPLSILEETIKKCKNKGLTTIVCASSISEIKKVAKFKPDYIAYEPPELIGKDISVTQAEPKIVLQAVEAVKNITRKTKVLCGAGIHSKEDLGQALLLGTHGVLIGHAVPKAKDPKRFLEGMLL